MGNSQPPANAIAVDQTSQPGSAPPIAPAMDTTRGGEQEAPGHAPQHQAGPVDAADADAEAEAAPDAQATAGPVPEAAEATPEATPAATGEPASLEIAFDTVVEHSQLASGSEHDTMIGLHLTAPQPPDDNTRAPVDCVVISDVSGSMHGEKMSLLKQTAKLLLSDLSKRDRVGLVTFDSTVTEHMRLSENKFLDAGNRQDAEGLVDKFRAGSSTNLSGGLFAGVEQFRGADAAPFDSIVPATPEQQGFSFAPPQAPSRRQQQRAVSFAGNTAAATMPHSAPPAPTPAPAPAPAPLAQAAHPTAAADSAAAAAAASDKAGEPDSKTAKGSKPSASVKTCLLLTDGEANSGVRDKDQLVRILKDLMKDCPGLSLSTFGYGGRHNSELLRALAEAGAGSYYFVETNDDIRTAFGDCLGGVLSIVAQNLVIDIRAAPGTRITKVHHPNAQCVTPGSHFTVRLNDLYGEEERDILVSAHLSKSTASAEAVPSLHCSMRYINVLTGRGTTLACVAAIQRPQTVQADIQADARIALHRHRITVAETMDEARREAERGDLRSAKQRLASLRQTTASTKAACMHVPTSAALFQGYEDDIDEAMDGLSDMTTFRTKTLHQMTNWSSGHMRQRCSESASARDTPAMRHNAYRTSAKRSKASMFKGKK